MGKKSLLSFEYQLPQDLLPVHSEAHGFGMLLTSFEGLDIVVMTAVVVVAVVSSLLLLLLVLLLLLLLQLPPPPPAPPPLHFFFFLFISFSQIDWGNKDLLLLLSHIPPEKKKVAHIYATRRLTTTPPHAPLLSDTALLCNRPASKIPISIACVNVKDI